MQIVIDIPDEQIEKSLAESKYIHENEGEKGSVNIVLLYTNKKLEFVDISRYTDFYSLTDKYTVLPKGHGRLGDLDEIRKDMQNYHDDCEKTSVYTRLGFETAMNVVNDAPTIIEADKESEICI